MNFFSRLWNRGKPAFVPETSDRETEDVSRGLSPEKVDSIMRAANSGDVRDQCRLAAELLEHNIEISQAVSTRINAVLGLHWSFEPGGKTPEAARAAEALSDEMRKINTNDNFDELLEDLMGALLPGFAISEILWDNGGHIRGFSSIEQRHFTLTEGYRPKLVTRDYPRGLVIPPDAVIYHRFRFHGKDPARGGLIRPLAWFHCFNNGTEKNLLAFMERYGMPFLVVRVDETTWQKERYNIKDLIRNFGSCGGGLFSKGTEQELLQASNTEGNVYFRMMDYVAGAINRLILGQTASSGDGGGLSKDGAQDKVRRDILESDCRRLERTINSQLCVPWTRFNFGPDVPPPRFVLDCAAPEDKLAAAQMVNTLSQAGFKADPQELSERFGMQLHYEAPSAAGFPMSAGPVISPRAIGLRDQPVGPIGPISPMVRGTGSDKALSAALESWLGPMADQIAATSELSDEELDKKLRSGVIAEPGDSARIEAVMTADMRREYAGN